MALLYTPSYVTIAEVKANTNNADLSAQTDDFINILIIEAQFIVDANIWPIYPKTEGQDFKFPNSDNKIPTDIKQATIMIVETLFINKGKASVESESWDWYSVKYDSNWKDYISSSASDILAKYWSNEWGGSWWITY